MILDDIIKFMILGPYGLVMYCSPGLAGMHYGRAGCVALFGNRPSGLITTLTISPLWIVGSLVIYQGI